MVDFDIKIREGEEIEILTVNGVRRISYVDLHEFECRVCKRKVKLWKDDAVKAYCSTECLLSEQSVNIMRGCLKVVPTGRRKGRKSGVFIRLCSGKTLPRGAGATLRKA